ncbi:MAG: sugar ABC transporter permease, partial [Anaerolineae bacterium]|nr:sugar ABC transporter permease [Anaerolineae bacterium]
MSSINAPMAKSTWLTRLSPNLRTREALAAYAFLAPFMIFFAIFFLRAVFKAVEFSFYDWRLLRPTKPYIGLENYRNLIDDDIWWMSLRNTLKFTVLTVTGTTAVALGAAIAVTQKIRGQGFFRVVLYMPTLFSVGAIGLVWVWLLSTQFGVINYFLDFINIKPINWLGDPDLVIVSLSITTIWWSFGFPMLIFIAG